MSDKIVQINNPIHSNDRVYCKCGISPTINTMGGGNRQPFILMSDIKSFQLKDGYKQNNMVMYDDLICPCQTARQYKDPYKTQERERA